MAGAVVLGQIPLRVGRLQPAVFLRQLGLPDGEKQHNHRCHHDEGHHQKQGLVVHVDRPLGPGGGVHHRRHRKVEDAAHGTHQVDDGVALGAEGLGGHVGHQGHRRGAVGAHGHQKQGQHRHEARQSNR